MSFFLQTLRLGLANLLLHKLRSLLTALGIIIGVAAVVAIAAYGEGTKQAAIKSILDLGASNIIVRSVKPPESASAQDSSNSRLLMYGIKRLDVQRIEQTVGPIDLIVPLKQVGSRVVNGVRTAPAAAFGVTPDLLEATSMRIARGRYISQLDRQRMDNVTVIGDSVARRLFPLDDPIGQTLAIDDQTFRIVGVFEPVGLAAGAGTALVGRDLNFDVHIPMDLADMLYGDIRQTRSSGSLERTMVELHELIIQTPGREDVITVADKVRRVLELEHGKAQDVEVHVPLELLRQAERTQLGFTGVIVVIAGLSLLVGGIGIMNIMLATVTERTREIGVRRALGATRFHIIAQFLVETTVLAGIGGIIGLGVGLMAILGLTLLAVHVSALETPIFSPPYAIAAFIVAAASGVVFGLYPAIKAAWQDPIVALRHD